VGLAARGLRDLGHGKEPITDPEELAQVRRQARSVYLQAVLMAVVLTSVLLAV
jgi:hypothetical protein